MPRAGFRVPVLQHVAKIQLFSELAMGWGEKNGIFPVFRFKYQTAHYQLTIRQQTTIVDNKRLINGFFLTKVVSLQVKS
jgi:hypothetical protein